MGLVYLVALALGGGFLAVQFLLSGHDHGDFTGGHDLSGGDHADQGGGWFSPRFFTFALFAFGFAGCGLHFLQLASPLVAALLSTGAGLASGFLASAVFRTLRLREASSSASLGEASGQLARVLLPCGPERSGKVRVTLKGQSVDILATSDDPVEPGNEVVVVDVKDDVARVARLPEALRQ